jgi:hypothetical protein
MAAIGAIERAGGWVDAGGRVWVIACAIGVIMRARGA